MIRSAIFDGPGQPLRIVEAAWPTLQPGEVLVSVSLATICGSDLHTLAGKRTEPTPCVLGHEAVGVIEKLQGVVYDLDGMALSVGDRIVWSVAASCGACFYCNHDLPQKCLTLKKYGHTRHDAARGPSGHFASHVHLWPGTAIVKVPATIPDVVAAPASCATATVAACLRAIPEAQHVLVLGCGLLGLTACAMLHANGRPAHAVDRDAGRQQLATRFGAVERPLPEHGADAVLEFTGSTDLTIEAMAKLRIGGTLVLAGAVFPTPPLVLAPEMLIRRCLTLCGVHNYHPRDLRAALAFLHRHHGDSPFAEHVKVHDGLEHLAAAVETAHRERPLRVGVRTNLPG